MKKKNCEEDSEAYISFEPPTIMIHGVIDFSTSISVAKNIGDFLEDPSLTDKIRKKDRPSIIVDINCLGGFLEPTISIISTLRSCGVPIMTNVTGVAYSAAAVLALAGDVRKITKIGSIMFHHPKQGNDEEELRRVKHSAGKGQEHVIRVMTSLLKDTNISYKDYCKKVDDNEWFLSPKEAKGCGIVHEIY